MNGQTLMTRENVSCAAECTGTLFWAVLFKAALLNVKNYAISSLKFASRLNDLFV